jgi:Amt family ammonium transporter
MAKTPLQSALLAFPRLTFRAKAFGLAAVGATIPVALLAAVLLAPALFNGVAGRLAAVVAITASALTLVALRSLLAAVGAMSDQFRASIALASIEPSETADEVAAMLADLPSLASRLESVRHRLANRHPVTGVATREPLIAAIAKDLANDDGVTALLGVIRLAQFDRLAAVDRAGAERVLQAFAARLTHELDGARPLAQVDRDSFAVWFCDAGGPRAAREALRDLTARLSEPMSAGEASVTPDVRVGAAVYPDDGADGPTLLARAVGALSKAIRMANGRLAYFSDESSAAVEERFSMEHALRLALSRQELTLCYQPVIDLTAGRVVGAEALLRWRHPELGPVPPAQFLPVMEQSGLIEEVGRWVLDTACRDAKQFESLGLPGFRVGVNLSERQFRTSDLPTLVTEMVARHQINAHRLELELTERSLMEDLERTRKTFEALGALGVGVAIDDFGAGASSLGDLKSLPFTKLKIDRAFVTDVAARHDSQAICAALIELGRRLDIAVLAEGVETREEVEALRVLGCSLFQGFFFSRPLPVSKFIAKVADPEWLALLTSPAERPVVTPEQRLAS